MNLIFRSMLLTASISISMPVGAAEISTAPDNSLEHRVSELEARVSALESLIKSTSPTPPKASATGNWKDLKNWRQLRTGMSYEEVRALLGEPESIDGGSVAYWYWGNRRAHVVFISDKVHGWSEPN